MGLAKQLEETNLVTWKSRSSKVHYGGEKGGAGKMFGR